MPHTHKINLLVLWHIVTKTNDRNRYSFHCFIAQERLWGCSLFRCHRKALRGRLTFHCHRKALRGLLTLSLPQKGIKGASHFLLPQKGIEGASQFSVATERHWECFLLFHCHGKAMRVPQKDNEGASHSFVATERQWGYFSMYYCHKKAMKGAFLKEVKIIRKVLFWFILLIGWYNEVYLKETIKDL